MHCAAATRYSSSLALFVLSPQRGREREGGREREREREMERERQKERERQDCCSAWRRPSKGTGGWRDGYGGGLGKRGRAVDKCQLGPSLIVW